MLCLKMQNIHDAIGTMFMARDMTQSQNAGVCVTIPPFVVKYGTTLGVGGNKR